MLKILLYLLVTKEILLQKFYVKAKKNTQLELLCMTFDKWLRGPKRQKHVEFSKNKTQLSRRIMKVCVICREEYIVDLKGNVGCKQFVDSKSVKLSTA